MGGNIPGGNFVIGNFWGRADSPGASLVDRNFLSGSFPDTDFRSTILQLFRSEHEQKKKRVVMRATRKKLKIFTFQLPICYILEQEISTGANADIVKTKGEK